METVSHFGILFAYVRTIQPLLLNGYRVPSVKPFSEFGSIGEANTYGTASSKRRRSHWGAESGGIAIVSDLFCWRIVPKMLVLYPIFVMFISSWDGDPQTCYVWMFFWWKQSNRLELGCVRSLFEVASSLLNALLAAKSRRSLDVETKGNGKL